MCLYFDGLPIKDLASNRMAGVALAAYKYKNRMRSAAITSQQKNSSGAQICTLLHFIVQTFSFNAGIEAAFSKRF
jgi:hypothetical protein